MKNKRVAGVYFQSGKGSPFISCIFNFYAPGGRWLLDELYISGEKETFGEVKSFERWVSEKNISDIVLNIPVSYSICETCNMQCPGVNKCENQSVVFLKKEIEKVLNKDRQFEKNKPKEYEEKGRRDNKYNPFKVALKFFSFIFQDT